ncbi:MAG: methylated-DNA--[protein]-cysteine S-methyltransferase [Polynucleobacter sp.]|nr:methylated-DNA--[protein]-cysteine S-methyltransferase [Polynucleobacter sp.]MDZ4057784.1 methylated-DNA--[protein]-cysteine S-methyltransferase [Polynucleobacter sp.]
MKTTKTTLEPDICVISAPFGRLEVATELVDGSLMVSQIAYLPQSRSLISPGNALALEVERQCKAYFSDPGAAFDLPLKPQGTAYQRRVWDAIAQLRPGQRVSYGDIAKRIRSGPRAVGSACGANYFPLVIPCHRVVAKTSMGGFMKQNTPGLFRDIKSWLLEHEARAESGDLRERKTAASENPSGPQVA